MKSNLKPARMLFRYVAMVLGAGLFALPAMADTGDTAWILTATALVLFMTLPGLALFYGGLVQAKNLLSVLMQCFAVACLMSVVWLIAGYSIAFNEGADVGSLGSVWGGFGKVFLSGVTNDSLTGTIPEGLFFAFQMTFAIITPALIVGAFAERVNFLAVLVFSAIWLLVVYAPVAHWIWGGGFLADLGVIDFAGGLVVHATAGVSALIFAIMLGRRRGFPTDLVPPHRPGYVMIGAAMLWVGWFGFNGGSALGANSDAARALLVTHISAVTASLVWMALEWSMFKRPNLVGIATGMVAGLATITPAAGSVGPVGAFIIGLLAGSVCYGAVVLIRGRLKIDDSLDVFAVHGVGGILGTLLIPFLAALGPMAPGLGDVSVGQAFAVQLQGALIVIVWSAIASFAILSAIRFVVPLRVDENDEEVGLDAATHGESAYT